MKRTIYTFYFLLISLIILIFSNCSGGGKEKEKMTADSIAHAKIVTDSLKKIEDAKPKFLVIQGTQVNLRVDPSTKADRIKQLKTGDTCEIIEKGNKDTVNDVVDFWYKIKRKSKEGWVFGTFTSLKLQKEKQDKPNTFLPTKKAK